MKLEELPTPEPPPAHVLVNVRAAGINFFDTQLRNGLHKRGLPVAMGVEGAGIVKAIAADVKVVKPGGRVCWVHVPGSYATRALIPPARPAPLPDVVSFTDAAATIFQGMTAH